MSDKSKLGKELSGSRLEVPNQHGRVGERHGSKTDHICRAVKKPREMNAHTQLWFSLESGGWVFLTQSRNPSCVYVCSEVHYHGDSF